MGSADDVCRALARSLSWEHERVVLARDADSGLEAVIAIHSTVLGPALGGLRIRRYERGMAEALDDVLRLSRAMTLKASAAGLDLGGGKAVVLDDGACVGAVRAARLRALAREIDRLDGAYITAEDLGTTTADMDLLGEHTEHVVGRTRAGGVGGDPSPSTARTVLGAMAVALEVLEGDGPAARVADRSASSVSTHPPASSAVRAPDPDVSRPARPDPPASAHARVSPAVRAPDPDVSRPARPDPPASAHARVSPAGDGTGGEGALVGRTVGVIGIGKVGGRLAELLVEAGARVLGADPDEAALERARALGVEIVTSADALMARELDVLAPCAVGGMIDERVAARLRCRVVCGAANNPLADDRAAAALARRGVLAVPDFLANCGGLIHVDWERRRDDDAARLDRALTAARDRTRAVLLEARADDRTPSEVAEEHAWARIRAARHGDALSAVA